MNYPPVHGTKERALLHAGRELIQALADHSVLHADACNEWLNACEDRMYEITSDEVNGYPV